MLRHLFKISLTCPKVKLVWRILGQGSVKIEILSYFLVVVLGRFLHVLLREIGGVLHLGMMGSFICPGLELQWGSTGLPRGGSGAPAHHIPSTNLRAALGICIDSPVNWRVPVHAMMEGGHCSKVAV